MGKEQPFQQMVLEELDIHWICKGMEIELLLHTYTNTNSKWIKDLTLKL